MPTHNFISQKRAQSAAEKFFKKLSKRHSIKDFSDADINEYVIRTAIRTAVRVPSGANQQPWHFVTIKDAEMKRRVIDAPEAEEQGCYSGGGGDEWLSALETIGTGPNKPHITTVP